MERVRIAEFGTWFGTRFWCSSWPYTVLMSRIPLTRPARSRFSSLDEVGEWMNAHAEPARDDDTPVLAGQTGPRRRASRAELLELVNEQRARYGLTPAE